MADVMSVGKAEEEEAESTSVRRILLSVRGASEQEEKHDRGKDCGNHAASMRLVNRHSSSIASQRIFLAVERVNDESSEEAAAKRAERGRKTKDERQRRGRRNEKKEKNKECCSPQPLVRRQAFSLSLSLSLSQLATASGRLFATFSLSLFFCFFLSFFSLFPLIVILRIARTCNCRLTSSNDFAEAAESSSSLRREAEVEVDARW